MLTFKPLTQEDYQRRTRSKVVNSFVKSGYDQIVDTLEYTSFGAAWSREEASAERDNCRNYLSLELPVLNMFMCQSDGSLLKKVLGLEDRFLKDILAFEKVYDVNKKEYKHVSDLEKGDNFLASGSLINNIIDNIDLKREIEIEFLSIIRDKFYKDGTDFKSVGTVDKNSEGGFDLIGDYYFHPNIRTCIKRGANLNDVTNYIQYDYMVNNTMPRITYLINTNKQTLYSFINKNIMVVPPGLRPRLGSKNFDSLTQKYARVIEANTKLRASIHNDVEPNLIIEDYKKLTERVMELQSKSDPNKPNEFSIKELISGKGRHIRGEMLLKRADYSGRSAITHDPKLRPDQIGIPIEMIPKLYAYHYVRYYPNKLIQFMEGKISNELVVKDLKKAGAFDEVPVLFNRQPTLHKLGYQAFFCVPVKSKSIRLPSLINESYNADFDGDQGQVNVPLSSMAIKDARELLYCMHNLYKPSTGRSVVNLRLDMIYGWYMATRYSVKEDRSNIIASYNEFICNDSEKYNVSKVNYDDPRGMSLLKMKNGQNKQAVPYGIYLYNDLYRNKISATDTINYKGEVGTAGRLVLKAILDVSSLPRCPLTEDTLNDYRMLLDSKNKDDVKKFLKDSLDLAFNLKECSSPQEYNLKDFLEPIVIKSVESYFSFESDNAIEEIVLDNLLLTEYHTFVDLFKEAIDDKSYNIAGEDINKLVELNKSSLISTIKSYYSNFFKIVSTSKIGVNPKADIANKTILKDKLLSKELLLTDYVKIGDRVDTVGNFFSETLVADKGFFPPLEITSNTIETYMKIMLRNSVSKFTDMLHLMTLLAFRFAKINNPELDIFETLDVNFEEHWEGFHKTMQQITNLYDDGFLTEETYTSEFNDKYKIIDNKLGSMAMNLLSADNGFKLMAMSGARGSKNNIMQIFTHKGRIAKPDGSSFNSAIEHSFIYQLSPLEHGISATGARKGMLDKSVKPGETGYVERISWHSTGDFKIVCDDCGTTEGLTWTLAELQEFDTDIGVSPSEKIATARKKLRDLIVNRYEAETNKYIDDQYADEIVATRSSVTVRSIAKCKNPCCAKCYGMDLTTNAESIVGETIGIKAAQSIGEPGTQLVMRSFHSGGVAGRVTMGSAFDRLQRYIKLTSTIKKDPMYCPTAWATGEVQEITTKDRGVKVIKIIPSYERDEDGNKVSENIVRDGNYKKKSIPLDNRVKVKNYVRKGEGLLVYGGDRYIKEIEEYQGIDEAIKYFILMCYFIYEKEAKMDIKNFEVLAASLVMNLVLKTDNPELKIGQHYTASELALKGDLSGSKIVKVFRSSLMIPILRESPLANIAMENVGKGLARSIILQNEDSLVSPLRNIMIGVEPKVGSYYSDYINKRNEVLRDL